MNSVYLILVAFSVINIAAGGPLRQQMRMYEEFQMCQGKLTTKVADICNIYHSHPELIDTQDEEPHDLSMVIFEDKKKISMTTLCCYNKCMVQDVIMHFCRNQNPYQVIEPIQSEEFSDIDMQLDTTIPKTNTPYLVPGSLLTAETLGDDSP